MNSQTKMPFITIFSFDYRPKQWLILTAEVCSVCFVVHRWQHYCLEMDVVWNLSARVFLLVVEETWEGVDEKLEDGDEKLEVSMFVAMVVVVLTLLYPVILPALLFLLFLLSPLLELLALLELVALSLDFLSSGFLPHDNISVTKDWTYEKEQSPEPTLTRDLSPVVLLIHLKNLVTLTKTPGRFLKIRKKSKNSNKLKNCNYNYNYSFKNSNKLKRLYKLENSSKLKKLYKLKNSKKLKKLY